MAINLITGRPGSGKSYEAVAYAVLPALRDGRNIVTNLPLNLSAFARLSPEWPALIHIITPHGQNPIPFQFVTDYTAYEGLKSDRGIGPLYVVDEAHMAIPAGNKNSDRKTLEWFAVHRHSATDVLLITQNHKKLHRYVTALVESHIVLSKNRALGSEKTYRRSVRDGIEGPQLGTVEIRKYKREFFPLYQTHMREGGEEAKGTEKTIFSHWLFRYAMPLVFIILIWSFSRLDLSIFDSAEEKKAKALSARGVELRKQKRESISLTPRTPPPLPDITPVDVTPPPLTGYPFEGTTWVLKGSVGSGAEQLRFVWGRQPDGRILRTTSRDLSAAGYEISFPTDCIMKMAYRRGEQVFETVAMCGKIDDLPPVYYLDPTTLSGRTGLEQLVDGVPTASLPVNDFKAALPDVSAPAIAPPALQVPAQAPIHVAPQPVNVPAQPATQVNQIPTTAPVFDLTVKPR